MEPKYIVLSGTTAMFRTGNLIRSMISPPPNLDGFGGVMVELMSLPDRASATDQANCIQGYMRQFELSQSEDPGFDQRIMFEALIYCANQFRIAWLDQIPSSDVKRENYRFHRWLGDDLVLERR